MAGHILSINTLNDALSVKNVPFWGVDDDGSSLGVKTRDGLHSGFSKNVQNVHNSLTCHCQDISMKFVKASNFPNMVK